MLTAMRISGLCAACALFSAASGLGAPLAGAQTVPIGALSQPVSKTEASSRISDAEIVRDLRSEMDQLAAEDRFSGVVLLSKDGQPLFEHAYGFADHAFSAPNNVDTKFNMASMTKVFTTVAILQLVERGGISLDETLAKALPDYPNQEAASKITIHELLGHKSGLGDFFGAEFSASNPTNYRTLRDYLPLFATKPLLFEPGTRTSYSNAGFIVLGLVIEHVSGKSYYDYVQDQIFKPANMTDTGFWSYEDDVPNVALSYTRLAPGQSPGGQQQSANTPRGVAPNFTRGQSAGSSFSCVEDLVRFSEALRNHKLLTPESIELILSGGYGLGTQSMNGVRSMSHAGGLPGANTSLEIYPDQGYAVVILSNFDPPVAQTVAQRLRHELVGAERLRAIQLPVAALAQFAGIYQAAPPPGGPQVQDRPIVIAADREGLWVTLDMGDVHEFVPLSGTEFFDRDTLSSARLTFTKDEKGGVTGLRINGSGPIQAITAAKLP
jgi:CubicO group peptidase (beta-lactamase class C family)